MKIGSITIFLFFFFHLTFLNKGISQIDNSNHIDQSHIIFKEGSKYSYNKEKYKFEELEIILRTHPEALDSYYKAVKKRKLTRNALFTFISSSALTGAMILAIGDDTNIGNGNNISYYFGVMIYGAVSIISLPIFLINVPFSVHFTKKTIDHYNELKLNQNGYKKRVGYINLKVNTNGLSLVYSF